MGMLAGQAYGAGNKQLVGIWMQVAYFVLGCACVFVAIAWSLTGTVLRAFGQSDEMSSNAQYFASVLMLCLPVRVAASQLGTFFTSQKIMKPTMVSSVFAMLANLAFGLIFVLGIPIPGWNGFGFVACPWVTTCVEFGQILGLWFVTCYWLQLHVACWPGWSWSHITRDRIRTYLSQYLPQTL